MHISPHRSSRPVLRLLLFVALAALLFAHANVRAEMSAESVLLREWARGTTPDTGLLDGLLKSVDTAHHADEFEALVKAAAEGSGKSGEAFLQEVCEKLDLRRFALVDECLQEVYRTCGGGLEAVVRTGSSGLRYLQLKGVRADAGRYRLFFSDDDISFVGEEALRARNLLNELLERRGLDRLKVHGFDLMKLKQIRNIDLLALNMMDPEAYLGEAGMATIKGESLKSGAVIAERSGGALVSSAEPLASFVEAKKSAMLTELMEKKSVAEAVRKFGPLTAVGSCERQMVAHAGPGVGRADAAQAGWNSLDAAEKVKYVQREREALLEAGGAAELGLTDDALKSEIEMLKQWRKAGTLSAEQIERLVEMRLKNVEAAIVVTGKKMDALLIQLEGVESIAGNPQVRRFLDEITVGFAMLRDGLYQPGEERMLQLLKQASGQNGDIYRMLYTAYEQSKDLAAVVKEWVSSGKSMEAFLEMLRTSENRLALIRARRVKVEKARPGEAKALQSLEEAAAKKEGESFLSAMLKKPAARKFLGALLITGAATTIHVMYEKYQGTYEDISTSCFAMIEFVPGGITFKRSLIEGVDKETAFSFVREALYLTPLWKVAAAADLLELAVNVKEQMTVSSYEDGLVDLIAFNGTFEPEGERYVFTGLALPGGRTVPKDAYEMEHFLFTTKYVEIRTPVPGWDLRINDLSEKANLLFDKVYLPRDQVLQELKKATKLQLEEIQKAQIYASLGEADIGAFELGVAQWLVGYEGACTKTDENWSRLFRFLKGKVEDRVKVVRQDVMVPDLVRLAEERYGTLHAEKDVPKKLDEVQKELEALRGGRPLDVRLADEVGKSAQGKVRALTNPTREQIALEAGKYWQEALAQYRDILEKSRLTRQKIVEKTGYADAWPLRFHWTGDFLQDRRRRDQSQRGFGHALSVITADLAKIKGSQGDPKDAVDREAYRCLGNVVFTWRMDYDEQDKDDPSTEPGYRAAYEDALATVKELYQRSGDFQRMLEEKASIVVEGRSFTPGESSTIALSTRDTALLRALEDGTFSLTWSADCQGTFKPDRTHRKVTFAPYTMKPVVLRITVERKGVEKKKGTLQATVPIDIPQDLVKLTVTPREPEKGELMAATLEIAERYRKKEYVFSYRWRGSNCSVENENSARALVKAPPSGSASVTCDLFVETAPGQSIPIATRTVSFKVKQTAEKKPPGKEKPSAQASPDGAGQAPSPGEDIVIDAPKEVKATDIFTATASLPAGVVRGADSGVWGYDFHNLGDAHGQSTKLQFVPFDKSAQTARTLKAQYSFYDTKGNRHSGSADVLVKPVLFSCSVPGPWEGGNKGNALHLKRRDVEQKNDVGSGVVTAEVHVEWDRLSGQSDVDDWNAKLKEAKQEKKPFSIADFKGYIVEEPLTYKAAAYSGDIGWVAHEGISARGYGAVLKGRALITFRYTVSSSTASGVELGRAFYEGEGGAARDEARAILEGITLSADGAITAAPALERPTVKLVATSGAKLRMGEAVSVNAVVEKARADNPPTSYAWSGGVTGAGASVSYQPSKPGKQTLSVEVRGPKGAIGSASLEFEVTDIQVLLTMSPADAKVLTGGSRTFRAAVTSGGQPVAGRFTYRWQPSTELAFAPQEEASPSTTTAFPKPGKVKVWVEVLAQKDGALSTVGESNQIEIEVAPPRLSLVFTPAQPYVAQQVTARVDAPAGLDEADFRWEFPGNVRQMGESRDSREATFLVKDTRPAEIVARGRVPGSGEELGEARGSVQARQYAVSVKVRGALGPAPRVWKNGVGVVDAPGEVAVFQSVRLDCEVSPAPGGDVRYQWSVNEDSHFDGNDSTREVRVNRSRVGTCTASVTVRNADGIILGQGSGSFPVTVSQEMLNTAKEKSRTAGNRSGLAGTWSSNWGPVTLADGVPITGTWDQGGGKIGQFSQGAYDPSTRVLRLYYYQPWNGAKGWQKLTLSADGKTLAGRPDGEGGWDWTCRRERVPESAGGAGAPDATPPAGKGDASAGTASAGTASAGTAPAGSGAVVNLALRKPATQSSVYAGTGIDQGPQFGVDGILECAPRDPYLLVHTNKDNPPWWQVDLGAVFALTELRLYNRKACAQERAGTVQVFLSEDGATWQRAYAHDGRAFNVLTVSLAGRKARYVKLQLAQPDYLHFQECEVYGYQSAAPASTGPAYRKVDLSSIGGVAGMRGGEIRYKGRVPLGGSPSGGQFALPWFSSNSRHTQRARIGVGPFRANAVYVMAGCAWWPMGDTKNGKPVLRVRINGSIDCDLVSGVNVWEWNASMPAIGGNTEEVQNNDPYTRKSYVTRFAIPETDVTSVEIILLEPTQAEEGRAAEQQVIEFFGVTLGRE